MRTMGKVALSIVGVVVGIPLLLIAAYIGYLALTSTFPGLIPGASLGGTWTFIVPNRYTGHLAIRYRCPGGHRLVRDWHIVTHFSARGVDCVSDAAPTWSGDVVARFADGTPIIASPDPDHPPRTGTVFDGGGVEAIGGNTVDNPSPNDFIFASFYVGPALCWARMQAGATVPRRCNAQDDTVFVGHAFGYTFCPGDATVEQQDACSAALERKRSHAVQR